MVGVVVIAATVAIAVVENIRALERVAPGSLPAGEDAGGGEEDDGYGVGGTQQPMVVEGR